MSRILIVEDDRSIAELERECSSGVTQTEKYKLCERIRALRTMSSEAISCANALENYYDRRCPRHRQFTI